MNAIPKEKVLKVLQDSNKDINIVILPARNYLIDGEIVNLSKNNYSNKYVQCKNINDIRLVRNNSIITKYVDGQGNELLPYEYELNASELNEKKEISLDDEYAYKKFMNTWNPIYKNIQEISDPVKIEILESPMYLDNNPNIYCVVELNRSNESVYMYNREDVVHGLLEKEVKKYNKKYKHYFEEFDLKFELKIEKNLEFSKLNSDFIFGSKYNFKTIRGPKTKIEERYNRDKELVKRRVKEIFDRMCSIRLNWIDLQVKKDELLSEISTEDFLKVKRFIEYIEKQVKK